MSLPPEPRALIAEDEPLLAASLRKELARLWPQLEVVASVGDGQTAVEQALALQPDILFFDIRMPGLSGLEAAAELVDSWPEGGAPFPALVFITAYEQYAVAAFEAQALDYLLKPVQAERLAHTVRRLQDRLAQPSPGNGLSDTVLQQLREALRQATPAAAHSPALRSLQVSVGQQIQFLPLTEVLYLEAADKYVRVLTAQHEYLVRTPIRVLLEQLDPAEFWQIHRGTVVRVDAIASASRDAAGKLSVRLRQRPERLSVSRLYAYRFKAL